MPRADDNRFLDELRPGGTSTYRRRRIAPWRALSCRPRPNGRAARNLKPHLTRGYHANDRRRSPARSSNTARHRARYARARGYLRPCRRKIAALRPRVEAPRENVQAMSWQREQAGEAESSCRGHLLSRLGRRRPAGRATSRVGGTSAGKWRRSSVSCLPAGGGDARRARVASLGNPAASRRRQYVMSPYINGSNRQAKY